MATWAFRAVIVALLGVAASAAWLLGGAFNEQLALERAISSVIDVPPGDLESLSGEAVIEGDHLSLHLQNTTLWFLTELTLLIETTDAGEALQMHVVQNFRGDPWPPGAWNERAIVLPAGWSGRPVRYRIIAAEGYQ